MNIEILRKEKTAFSTIGEYYANGVFQCYTLEPPTPPKYPGVKGHSCVPCGKYQVTLSLYKGEVWNWMKKLVPEVDKYGLPLVSNISGLVYPDWTAENDGIPHAGVHADRHVYFHIGNTAADTLGCLLVGAAKGRDRIDRSTEAFKKIYFPLVKAIQNGEIVTVEYKEA